MKITRTASTPTRPVSKEIDVETVLESPIVADPLRLYDFCPITDGSAALLFCPESVAKEYADEYVVVAGIDGATDTHVVHEREDPTVMGGVVESGEGAYEMSGYGPDDVDVAELHDMFTILEFLQMEGLGFAEQGRPGNSSKRATPNVIPASYRSTRRVDSNPRDTHSVPAASHRASKSTSNSSARQARVRWTQTSASRVTSAGSETA